MNSLSDFRLTLKWLHTTKTKSSERFFSGYSGFPLSPKTNISKFQFDQESGKRRTTAWMCYLQIIIIIIIIF